MRLRRLSVRVQTFFGDELFFDRQLTLYSVMPLMFCLTVSPAMIKRNSIRCLNIIQAGAARSISSVKLCKISRPANSGLSGLHIKPSASFAIFVTFCGISLD